MHFDLFRVKASITNAMYIYILHDTTCRLKNACRSECTVYTDISVDWNFQIKKKNLDKRRWGGMMVCVCFLDEWNQTNVSHVFPKNFVVYAQRQ